MSEILQKTFKVLMGGGEGVGWSAPTPSSPHSLAPALANTLKHLALVTPKEEGELARRQLEQCCLILNNPDTTSSTITECIVRVMFLYLMGHDVSTLHIHAVKLAQAPNLLHRKLGYLASSLLLPAHSQLRIMVTNSIVKDLSEKSSVPSILTGLIASCNLITDPCVLAVFLERVQKLCTHPNYLVRTKALITLDRFCQIAEAAGGAAHKDIWQDLEGTIISSLSDQDPGVVSTAIQILSKRLVENGASCEQVLGPMLHVYKQIHDGRFPAEFGYKGLVAPWTQVHIMRTLSKMNNAINTDNRRKVAVTEIFQNILGIEFSKETMVQVLISEAVIAVSKLDCLKAFNTLAIKKISKYLQSKNNQVKYCGLDMLHQIFETSPPSLNGTQEDNVIYCLEHTDLSIQLKTLNLLITIVNTENHVKIVNSILVFIKKLSTQNEDKKVDGIEEHVSRIYDVIIRFSQSLDWTVESLLRLLQCSKGKVQKFLVESLKMALTSRNCAQDSTAGRKGSAADVTETFQSIDLASDPGGDTNSELVKVQKKFSQLMEKLIETGVKNPVIIQLYIWQLGYFSTNQNCNQAIDKILQTIANISTKNDNNNDNKTQIPDNLTCGDIISQGCWALLDVRIRTGAYSVEAQDFLSSLIKGKDRRLKYESSKVVAILKNLQYTQIPEYTDNDIKNDDIIEEYTDDSNKNDGEDLENVEDSDGVEVAQETLETEDFCDINDDDHEKTKVTDFKGCEIELPEIENMDFTLSFLDQVVYANLCQGGEAYVPLSMRTSRSQRQGDMNSSAEKPLITSAYGRIRKDTINSTRSIDTPPPPHPGSPSALPPVPKLWTAEGRVDQNADAQEKSSQEEIFGEDETNRSETIDLETSITLSSKTESLLDGW